MRPKYTASDIFRLRKPLKLLSIIDGFDEHYVDTAIIQMAANRDLSGLLTNFKEFFDEKLPGITHYRMKTIRKDFKDLKVKRANLQNTLRGLLLNNRLLPLSRAKYEEFGKRSGKHFKVLSNVIRSHVWGKYLAKESTYGSNNL